ncbi:CHAT domain-containing protein [Streptomyces avermitilis]|uniref:CHAT domain-containing tetratricopeptide repeat protein n=1 Tax=Streptomyces avermitilis TaxID=33903 RepID=UPI00339EA8CA
MQAQLSRIQATNNPFLAMAPTVFADAQRLEKRLKDGDGELEARYVLGWLRYWRFGCFVNRQQMELAHEEYDAALRLLVPCFIAETGPLPEPLIEAVADAAIDTANRLMDQLPHSTDVALITDAARLWQRIMEHLREDSPNQAVCLSNYGSAMEQLFERTGALTNLDEAIDAARSAIEATPPDDPDRARTLNNLGIALMGRFEQTGAQEDLDRGIEAARQAIEPRPGHDADPALALSNLSNALLTRFRRIGAPADLDEAIDAARRAVHATSDDHPDQPLCLSALSNSLRLHFSRTGSVADLDEAIDAARRAVRAIPDNHPDRATVLSNFAIALKARYARTGVPEDLDAAIDAARRGAAVRFGKDPYRVASFSTLCAALQDRFERLGASEDLDEAVEAGREAVALVAEGHPQRAIPLTDLAGALLLRFERSGRSDDLSNAIETLHQAVVATPDDHPDRAGRLSNLSRGLQLRFERDDVLKDLHEAIDFARQATLAARDTDPLHPVLQANLCGALLRRFRRTGDRRDLDESVDTGRRAVKDIPDDHPNHATTSSNLGHALRLRFAETGSTTDADEALAAFTAVVHSASTAPWIRIEAARFAADLAAGPQAARLLEVAVRLLPEVAPRQLTRSDQQYALGGLAGLASDAAAAVLSSSDGTSPGRAQQTRALQLLESGRAVLMSQALDTRSDITDLQRTHPDLAARFLHLRDQLDAPVPLDKPGWVPSYDAGVAGTRLEHPFQDRHSLVAEFNATVAAIRDLDGLKAFLLPPEPEELIAEARYGPVVVFNVSRSRGDALLLTSDGIDHLSLSELSESAVRERINLFHQTLSVTSDKNASLAEKVAAQETLSAVLEWLWDTTAEPVLSALGYQDAPRTGEVWPRVWWAPGGLLGLLPLHAAGHHREVGKGGSNRTVMDRVVSSYTPTIRALHHARRHGPAPSTTGPALIVAMPTTPDAGPLYGAADEAEMLHDRFPRSRRLINDDTARDAPEQAPTKANVLVHLAECAIAHFACHGSSDPSDPSQSRLLLNDHRTDPFTVASLSATKLDQASLAYLSACESAINAATHLIDEAIHLAAALQLAGFRRVVGTLWEIEDSIAVHIADAFYDHLTTPSGEVDTSMAAHALHQAVRRVRDERNLHRTPSLWAAHIHVGA